MFGVAVLPIQHRTDKRESGVDRDQLRDPKELDYRHQLARQLQEAHPQAQVTHGTKT